MDGVFQIYTGSPYRAYRGWLAHTSVKNSHEIIRNVLALLEPYAIVLKYTELPIGSIEMQFHIDLAWGDTEATLGYWLGVPYWGRGIVPEAAWKLLRHAFEARELRPCVNCAVLLLERLNESAFSHP